MSPLLFALVVEYFSRVLKCMSSIPDFTFYPLCKQLQLSHLIFANDLMIFCKANSSSVKRVMEALANFSDVYGLVANMEKSSIFMAGIDDQTRDQLLDITQFTQGTFPIKYLGLPLSSKKWNKMECQQLVDKITSRITTVYSKKLSCAGRLQIIVAVLFSIHNFWGSAFILPQSIL